MTVLLLIMLLWNSSMDQNTVAKTPCAILYDGIDIDSRLYKKEMKPAYWWSYSPREIKNNLKQENLITTSAQLMRIEKATYLNLNLELYSATAAQQYGSIKAGAQLVIKTINGRSYKLPCRAGSQGIYDEDTKRYRYAVSYPLSKKQIRGLLRSEVDKVGIQWSSGYEEYTVYEVALLLNQLSCLNQ